MPCHTAPLLGRLCKLACSPGSLRAYPVEYSNPILELTYVGAVCGWRMAASWKLTWHDGVPPGTSLTTDEPSRQDASKRRHVQAGRFFPLLTCVAVRGRQDVAALGNGTHFRQCGMAGRLPAGPTGYWWQGDMHRDPTTDASGANCLSRFLAVGARNQRAGA